MFERTRPKRLNTTVTHLEMTEHPKLQLGWGDERISPLVEDES